MLFVCLGNICRSPFAALHAARVLGERGRSSVRCASAGIKPSQAPNSPPEARQASALYDVSLEMHQPQAVTPELMAAHDVVFVMEHSQLHHLRTAYPAYRDRIFLLSLYDDRSSDPFTRHNIVDPFGQPLQAYKDCYYRIDRCVRSWVSQGWTARL